MSEILHDIQLDIIAELVFIMGITALWRGYQLEDLSE